MLALTAAEKNFLANYWHETLDLKRGPALNWLIKNGIKDSEIWPFTKQFQKEFGLGGVPRPRHCDIPWYTADEIRSRARTIVEFERANDLTLTGRLHEPEKARCRIESRTIAIGDIHGCSTALNRLIDVIQPKKQDTLVILGDVIDGGPDSRGVIESLLRLSQECRLISLMGNHEEMLLAALESRSEFSYWRRFGGDETLRSYGSLDNLDAIPPAQLRFLKSSAQWHESEEFIFVHANYDPKLPMDRQSGTRLRWEHLDPSEAKPHISGKMVIVGHTPQMNGNVLDLGFAVCLDTGCCEGGWLTALDVTTGHIWQSNQQGKLRERERELRESHA